MSFHSFSFFFITLLFLAFQASAEIEMEYELDPYYSNIGIFVPFSDEKIPTVTLKNEREIYLSLLKDAFTPSFFVVELSANPLPILGVYLKDHQTQLYGHTQITEDLNLIEALTEGFEEPYALSIFFGNVLKFTLPNETETQTINKGYSGFLFSIGNQHIRSNNLFSDNWVEFEWKLKGDRRIGNIYHSFSFRVGSKNHQHKNIESSYYFGVRREFFNSEIKKYDFLENIGIDLRVDYSKDTNELIQAEIFVDKRWPTKTAKISLGIGLKMVDNKYLNELDYLNQDVQLILRPSIEF